MRITEKLYIVPAFVFRGAEFGEENMLLRRERTSDEIHVTTEEGALARSLIACNIMAAHYELVLAIVGYGLL